MTSRRFIALALAGLCCAGCQEANTVSGTVTYNGEAVEEGAISFRPVDGQGRGFGANIVDGRYEVAESFPGKKRVLIVGVNKIDFRASRDANLQKFTTAGAGGNEWAGHLTEAADYISENAEGNNQTFEIAPGRQLLNFDLKGPPRK